MANPKNQGQQNQGNQGQGSQAGQNRGQNQGGQRPAAQPDTVTRTVDDQDDQDTRGQQDVQRNKPNRQGTNQKQP
jgi:hypothetical protein